MVSKEKNQNSHLSPSENKTRPGFLVYCTTSHHVRRKVWFQTKKISNWCYFYLKYLRTMGRGTEVAELQDYNLEGILCNKKSQVTISMELPHKQDNTYQQVEHGPPNKEVKCQIRSCFGWRGKEIWVASDHPNVILAGFPGFSPLPLAAVGSFFVSTKWEGAAILWAAF